VRETCGGNNLADPITQMTIPIAARMLGTDTLGLVSFSRDNPSQTVVASPFTGVFFDGGDGVWKSFGNVLPKPFTPPFAARLDKFNAYIGFAGRIIGRVGNPNDAARATYCKIESKFFPALGGGSQEIAHLVVSDGTDGAGEDVSIRIVGPDGTTQYDEAVLNLDNHGRVLVPL